MISLCLVHFSDEVVDVLLAVTSITTLSEVGALLLVATLGGRELEGPDELVGQLEVGTAGIDLVNEVLDAENVKLTELLGDDGVVGERDALASNLTITTLVDQVLHGLEVGVTPGDVGGDEGQHLLHGLGKADEDGVVDLAKTEELEDLSGLGINSVDTTDTDDESNLGLRVNVENTRVFGEAAVANEGLLSILVLLVVLLSTLVDNLASLSVGLRSETRETRSKQEGVTGAEDTTTEKYKERAENRKNEDFPCEIERIGKEGEKLTHTKGKY